MVIVRRYMYLGYSINPSKIWHVTVTPEYQQPCQTVTYKCILDIKETPTNDLARVTLGGELIKPEIKKNSEINFFLMEPDDAVYT